MLSIEDIVKIKTNKVFILHDMWWLEVTNIILMKNSRYLKKSFEPNI